MHVYSAQKVTDKVYWVGGIDWNLREMHGYETLRGTTYNAFLILSDKITLIDTVKHDRCSELLARIASLIDPQEIDYIVSLHAEMDHSGCLPEIMTEVKPEKVFASKQGRRALADHFGFTDEITEVKDGEVLDLGTMKLSCIHTPMLHWPDSMIAYLHEEKTLFTQDAFGMHLASAERFADELPHDILEYEGAKYFANILLPYAKLIPKLYQRLVDTGWDLAYIAPDHGPIWREQDKWILTKFLEWSRQDNHERAIIIYDSMWGATERMAQAITEGLQSAGARVELMRLEANHQSHVATELLSSGALLVGSPTLNGELFPAVAGCLTYLKGLRWQNLIGCGFGSFGWSGGAVKAIDGYLDAMNIRRIGDSISSRYMPTREDLALLHERGRQVAHALLHPEAPTG